MNRGLDFAQYRWRVVMICLLTLIAQSASGCGPELTSQWSNREVVIDGANTEWEGLIKQYPDRQLGVGLVNDDEFLYATLVIGNYQQQLGLLASGCTVWFDSTGEKQKQFGIQYPVGLPRKERGPFMKRMIERGDRQSLLELYASQATKMELKTAASGENRQLTIGEDGIEVAAKPSGNVVIYELKVPLSLAGITASDLKDGAENVISIGFETARHRPGAEGGKKLQANKRGGGQGGFGGQNGRGSGQGGRGCGNSRPGGGRGGNRVGTGGPGGSGGPGSHQQGGARPQAMNLWAKVALASPQD